MSLSESQARRYSRQTRLAEVGESGQQALRQAAVLVIGAGGLGSPALRHLVGAGIGRVGVVDFDNVDVSNLHRQTLFSSKDIGAKKSDVAARTLRGVNPEVDLEVHDLRLDGSNASRLISTYDLVLDGSDTFSTRYAVNDASVETGVPNVFSSVSQFSGQASVFGTERGPCYRCLFPAPPPPGLIPNCEDGGVLGVVPAIMGTIQATEALKLLLGIGDPLIGRLFLFDALEMASREIAISKDPACPVCGTGQRVDRAVVELVSREDLSQRMASSSPPRLIDVRSQEEHDEQNIGGQVIPLSEIEARRSEFAPSSDRGVVLYCASGKRSLAAAEALLEHGIAVSSLEGGIRDWRL